MLFRSTTASQSLPLVPQRIADKGNDWLAVVTQQGRLLVLPVSEIPELNKGKGNKLVDIKGSELAKGEDRVVAMASLAQGQGLKIVAGKRFLTLQGTDLEHYKGPRARRGNHLPRGFQRVDGLEAV